MIYIKAKKIGEYYKQKGEQNLIRWSLTSEKNHGNNRNKGNNKENINTSPNK
jgi:hypothetical protein